MPCYAPLKGFRTLEGVERGGKPRITFNAMKAINSSQALSLPCGQCIGCRIDRTVQWGVRISHESKMHSSNSFLTLTYSPENMPANGSVSKREAQLFLKRLRKEIEPRKVRFFTCGEYGDQSGHPHYHSIIFGYDFSDDRKLHKTTPRGDRLYTSDQLQRIWPYGHALIGDVTPKSAAYVAGYVTKKITGDKAEDHYLRVHPFKDEIHRVEPEFALQSRRPGLGLTWLERFKSDIFPSDFVIVDGKETKTPSYYVRKLQEAEQKKLKRTRAARAAKPNVKSNTTPDRLRVRETIKKDRLTRLKREI